MIHESIFLHYLDHELEQFWIRTDKAYHQQVHKELLLATKLACLLAYSSVSLPASNYFESKMSREILSEVEYFAQFGLIKQLSSSRNLDHFLSKKKNEQYKQDLEKRSKYEDKEIIIPGSWKKRERSATEDIVNSWNDSIDDMEKWKNIYINSKCKSIASFEKTLSSVPRKLENRAFISKYVVPMLLPKNPSDDLRSEIDFDLNTIITKVISVVLLLKKTQYVLLILLH